MNAFEVVGQYMLKGADKVAGQIDKVGTQASASAKKIEQSAESLGKLGSSITKVGAKLTAFSTGAVVGLVAGVISMGKTVGDTADGLIDLSDATGISTQTLQEYQAAAVWAGTGTNAIADASTRITRLMPKIREGTGAASEALVELGINTENFATLSADDRMSLLIEKFQGINDTSKRAELGVAIFSKRFESLVPVIGLGAEALAKARAEGAKWAETDAELIKANDFRIAMDRLQFSLGQAWEELSYALIPILNDKLIPLIEDKILPNIERFADAISGLIDMVSGISGAALKWTGIIGGLALVLGPIILTIGGIVTGIAGLLKVLGPALSIIMTMARFMTPWGIAITAVTVAVGYLIANWQTVIQVVRNAIDWISKAMGLGRVFDREQGNRQGATPPNSTAPVNSSGGNTSTRGSGGGTNIDLRNAIINQSGGLDSLMGKYGYSGTGGRL